jgi:hypothetical protein
VRETHLGNNCKRSGRLVSRMCITWVSTRLPYPESLNESTFYIQASKHLHSTQVQTWCYFEGYCNSVSVLPWNAGGVKPNRSKITLLPSAKCTVTEIQMDEGGKTLIFMIQTCHLLGFLTVNIRLLPPRKHIAPLLTISVG